MHVFKGRDVPSYTSTQVLFGLLTHTEVAPLVDEDPELLESAYWTKYSVQENRDLARLTHKKT